MGSWYENISNQIRKETSKLTKEQMLKLEKTYQKSFDGIIKELEKNEHGYLDEKFLLSQKNNIDKHLKILRKDIIRISEEGITKGTQLGIDLNKEINKQMLLSAGIVDDVNFVGRFATIQDNIIKDIIKGNIYKDNKTLSKRIWSITNANGKEIQEVITEGIILKKSSKELASDLQEFLKPLPQRNVKWKQEYGVITKDVKNKAERLARTTINHSYQNATIQSTQDNPFIEGIRWESAMQHGRTCEECMDRDGVVYPKDEVPLDHPNGMCTMIPEIPKSLAEIGSEIGRWVNGEENKQLDEWYDK